MKKEHIYRTILQTLPDIVYEIDTNGCFIYINDAVEKLGFNSTELIGSHFSDLIHPEDHDAACRIHVLKKMKGIKTGDNMAPRLFDERRSGQRLTQKLNVRLVHAKGSAIKTIEGEIISIGLYDFKDGSEKLFLGTLGIIRDKSEDHYTEEVLFRQKRHFKTLIENSSDLISILANDGTILYESDSIKRILKYQPIDLIGEIIYEYLAEEDKKVLQNILEEREVISEAGKKTVIQIKNKNNHYRYLESTISRVSNETDGTICFIMNSIDITDRKLAEDQIHESVEKFRAVLEHSMEVIIWADQHGEILYVSQSIDDFFGYSPFELVGKNVISFVIESDKQKLLEKIKLDYQKKENYTLSQFSILKKNGTVCMVEAGISNRIGVFPIDGFIINMRDISEIKEINRALKNSEEKYKNLYNSALVGMLTIEAEKGMILACNDLGYNILGYREREEIIGESFYEMLDESINMEGFIRCLKKIDHIDRSEIIITKKDGRQGWVAVTAKYNKSEGILDMVLVDVTETKDTEDQLFELTFFDALTKLPNKALFGNRITIEILKQKQSAVMCMGMDNFKKINEVYGIEFGDRVLQKIANDLNEEFFKKDLVCRFAEDKFMILLAGLGVMENHSIVDTIDTIAHKIRMFFSRSFIINKVSVEIIPSIGIAIYPPDGDSADQLMKNSESAMYVAKEKGGGTFHYYDAELNREMMYRFELEKDLKNAIKRKEFIPYFQPKVDSTGKIIGMESLIRWNRGNAGCIIMPCDFIPLAEKNTMIVDIGLLMLEESCRQNKKWQDMGHNPIRVAVNLSPFQFKQEDLIQKIAKVIKYSELDPEWLELEITESGIMEDEADSIKKLNELHDMGIALSIDDFGTGYSSLSKLKNYPIDALKIDKSFVEDIPEDVASVTLVRTIIDMAHNLDFKVIAEGVENEEQFNFLRAVRCDTYQGYYFSRPINSEEFAKYLLDNEKKYKN